MKLDVTISIAKKEIIDNIRNKWIILVSLMFALLTLVVSYYGSLGSVGWQDLGMTISIMASLVTFLVPIIALMLGYAAIIGEIERGSMNSLLSLSTTRLEVVAGKFIGLAGVLCFTILVGFGAAGLIIAANVPNVNYLEYIIFLAATMLLGLVFLSIALCLSTVFNKRSNAMGGAIFLWFLFNIILPLVFLGLLATNIHFMSMNPQNPLVLPDWYTLLNLFNPIEVYSSLLAATIGPVSTMNVISAIPAPSWYSGELLTSVLLLWIITFLLISIWRFERKDI